MDDKAQSVVPPQTGQPDLESSQPSPNKRQSSFTQRWAQTIDPKYADLICLLLCFVTGLCDSASYNAWTCFLAMQTGTPSSSKHPIYSPLPS